MRFAPCDCFSIVELAPTVIGISASWRTGVRERGLISPCERLLPRSALTASAGMDPREIAISAPSCPPCLTPLWLAEVRIPIDGLRCAGAGDLERPRPREGPVMTHAQGVLLMITGDPARAELPRSC